MRSSDFIWFNLLTRHRMGVTVGAVSIHRHCVWGVCCRGPNGMNLARSQEVEEIEDGHHQEHGGN